MRDFIVQGAPEAKIFRLTVPLVIGGITIPAGTELTGDLLYRYPVLDNDPTLNNKANLLTDDTAALLGLDIATATVNLAFEALSNALVLATPTTFERLMTGRIP